MGKKDSQSRRLEKPLVGIIMGSASDSPMMSAAAEALNSFGVSFEFTIVSAHRTPRRMVEYAESAKKRGLKVIIAGAGGAAHLPGMIASLTTIPVIGVPIKSHNSLDGWDSLLSSVQVPVGVPVATVAVNGAKNAGILAAQMIANFDDEVSHKLELYKNQLTQKVEEAIDLMKQNLPKRASN